MGEAKERGTAEERREEAVIESAQAIICLRAQDGGVHCATIIPAQDEDNPAIVLAGYINANLPELMKAAMDGRQLARTAVPHIVTSVKPRLAGLNGPLDSAPALLGPDGRALQ